MTSQHPSTERIIDYIHGELSPAEDSVLFAHFAECSDCRADYETELRLTAALQSAAAAETLDLPSTVKAQVWSSVRETETGGWRAFLRPIIAVPVAAAIALAVFFSVQNNAPKAAHPAVGAQAYFDVHNAATRQENPLTDRSAPVLDVIEATDASSNAPFVQAARAAAGDDSNH
jgi:anti-sigma factor RsiW